MWNEEKKELAKRYYYIYWRENKLGSSMVFGYIYTYG